MAPGTQVCRPQIPPELDRITDVVLLYKPKQKTKPAQPKRKKPPKSEGKKKGTSVSDA